MQKLDKQFHTKFSFASFTGRYMNANIIHALKEIDRQYLHFIWQV